MTQLKLFVGYDPREQEAYDVFVHSVRAHSDVEIIPLVRSELQVKKLFSRDPKEPAATEFSFTRFLVPFLSGYDGLSIFADCDMLMQTDIRTVLDDLTVTVPNEQGNLVSMLKSEARGHPNEQYAAFDSPVYVCKHDYIPRTQIKMDGVPQVAYPRKNWSSFMVFNNSMCRILTPEYVSRVPGRDLHQFYWLGAAPEIHVGSLPPDWNWLVGEFEPNPTARNLHYTLGGPWFKETVDCELADLWISARDRMRGQA